TAGEDQRARLRGERPRRGSRGGHRDRGRQRQGHDLPQRRDRPPGGRGPDRAGADGGGRPVGGGERRKTVGGEAGRARGRGDRPAEAAAGVEVPLTPLTRVRIAGLAEGVSFLLLLGVAMPLKYFADYPMAVTVVGTIHGVLFILFGLAVLDA